MADPFFAEIRIFSFEYAPVDWAYCDGASIPAAQNQPLFSIISNIYGGNSTMFNLPDMRGYMPMHRGSGPYLTPHAIAQKGGSSSVTLTSQQLPQHKHNVCAAADPSEATVPTASTVIGLASPTMLFKKVPDTATTTNLVAMAPESLTPVGAAAPLGHENRQPYCALNFCISLNGVYPVRS
jgi:microcystin-dependent protein